MQLPQSFIIGTCHDYDKQGLAEKYVRKLGTHLCRVSMGRRRAVRGYVLGSGFGPLGAGLVLGTCVVNVLEVIRGDGWTCLFYNICLWLFFQLSAEVSLS